MPFTAQHIIISNDLPFVRHQSDDDVYFDLSRDGSLKILHTGKLDRRIHASLLHQFRVERPEDTRTDLTVLHEDIDFEFHLYDPDGNEFTGGEITLADLRKSRDMRGSARPWGYSIKARSGNYHLRPEIEEAVSLARCSIFIGLSETIASSSGDPLVRPTAVGGEELSFKFDLFRLGQFVAHVTHLPFQSGWQGSMTLFTPDGIPFATTTTSRLACQILPSALGQSRDAGGVPRLWTLVVRPRRAPQGLHFVSATVIAEGRIGTTVVQDRLQWLLGENGDYIDLVGRNENGKAEAVLTIKEVATAETIDMVGLFDSVLGNGGKPVDLTAEEPAVIADGDEEISHEFTSRFAPSVTLTFKLDVGDVKLAGLTVDIGPGDLVSGVPALRFHLAVEGAIHVMWNGLRLADVAIKGGKIDLEIGMQIDQDGTPLVTHACNDDPFDVILNETATTALFVASPFIAALGITVVQDYLEGYVEGKFSDYIDDMFDDPSLGPRILMMMMGTHLTYSPPRFDGTDLLFEHIAPIEPDPRPLPNYFAAIGREVRDEAVGHPTFHPFMLGDTWKADNLNKIDHIVVVMMENRSYDHVLGYRSMPAQAEGGDGITQHLIDTIAAGPEGHSMRPLRNAGFNVNAAGLRTRLPKGVGHELDDVTEQLAGRITMPPPPDTPTAPSRAINDPAGFVNNFRRKKLEDKKKGVTDENGLVVPDDVLGYYEKSATEHYADDPLKLVDDLPVFGFLAENYAYCDRYFSSHPGPTFPNRMFSLAGDLEHDRYGFPILDSNDSDNFLLSRAPTIYDVLTRESVSWRVYESFPSVTMLRMFARYATDDVNIRPLDELAADVQNGNLPHLTVIEPAMHHHPEDDDHPDADMYRGQRFVWRVLDALQKNSDVWLKTMLVITYDEHGGLYDHVIPPIADVYAEMPLQATEANPGGQGAGTAGNAGEASGGNAGGGVTGPPASTAARDDVPAEPSANAFDHGNGPVQVPYGVRVPTFVVSPWVAPGKGPGMVLDHCSILKTVLARFCGDRRPFLSDRVEASHSFEDYLAASDPRLNITLPPEPDELPIGVRRTVSASSQIITPPLYRKRMREEQVDYHDISGRLARMLGR